MDPWKAFAEFLTGVVDSDVHAPTVHLAGTFESTDELRDLAQRSGRIVADLVGAAQNAGALRQDITAADLPMIFEQLTAVKVEDATRTAELRRRYLALHLDAMRRGDHLSRLDPPGPTEKEIRERWSSAPRRT